MAIPLGVLVAMIPTLLSQAGCVYTCVCVHMSVYTTSEHACTLMHMLTCVLLRAHLCMYVHIYVCICMNVHTYSENIHTFVHIHLCVLLCVLSFHMHVCIYVGRLTC